MLTLTKYNQTASKSYGNRNGTPLDESRCQAMCTQDNGRGPNSYYQCRKPPKPDTVRPARQWHGDVDTEIPVCGLHAGIHDRAEAKKQAYAERRAAEDAAHEKAQAACDELRQQGIAAAPYFRHGYGSDLGSYTGDIIIKPDVVLGLLPKGVV